MKKPILYIIPGFGENTRLASYRQIIATAKMNGYEVVQHTPRWDRRVATQWVNDFKRVAEQYHGREQHVLGFSFGAYIAVLCAKELSFKELILCSISPYFRDNIKDIPEAAWKFFGKRRRSDFTSHSFPSHLTSKAFFLVGEKEIPLELRHVKFRFDSWSGKKKLIVIKGAEHALESGEYIPQIVDLIKKP